MILPHRKSAPSFANIDTAFDRIKYLFTFFDYIELKDVRFKNDTLTIVFADDVLYITSNQYEVAGNIHRVGKKFEADVSLLYLKKDNVRISGTLQYDFKQTTYAQKGSLMPLRLREDLLPKREPIRSNLVLRVIYLQICIL